MKSTLYPEECCEICHEIVHCHFDCPVCDGHRPTTMYGESCLDEEKTEFTCEKCRTNFKILSRQQEENGIMVEIEEVKNEKEI